MLTNKTRTLTGMGMLTALSLVLIMLINFPILPAVPFMKYDPADVPILIGTFLFGTSGGLILTVLVSVLQGLLSAATADLSAY